MSNKINSLQKQKLELQLELNTLLHTSNQDQDKINELKSEILYLDKQIERIVGKKEIERQAQLKNKKSGIEEMNKKNYYGFKAKFKRISPMTIATIRMIGIIDKIETKEIQSERVKVK